VGTKFPCTLLLGALLNFPCPHNTTLHYYVINAFCAMSNSWIMKLKFHYPSKPFWILSPTSRLATLWILQAVQVQHHQILTHICEQNSNESPSTHPYSQSPPMTLTITYWCVHILRTLYNAHELFSAGLIS